jgi:hypothetical protein
MLKLLITGVLGCAAALGGVMANKMMNAPTVEANGEGEAQVAQVKTDMAGVPVIAAGQVKAYLVFQVSSTIDVAKLPSPEFLVAPYLQDAAIRASFQTIADGLTTFNAGLMEALAERLRREANQRIGAEVVKAVNIEAFNYVPKEDIRGNMLTGARGDDGH